MKSEGGISVCSHNQQRYHIESRLHLASRRRESDLTKEFKARSRATPPAEWKPRSLKRRRDTKEPARASIDSLPVYIFVGLWPACRSRERSIIPVLGIPSDSLCWRASHLRAEPYFIFRNGGPATGKNRYRFDRFSPFVGTIRSPNCGSLETDREARSSSTNSSRNSFNDTLAGKDFRLATTLNSFDPEVYRSVSINDDLHGCYEYSVSLVFTVIDGVCLGIQTRFLNCTRCCSD